MSVVKSKRTGGDLEVIIRAKELCLHTTRVVSNENYFPKRYRLTYTDKMINKSIDIYTALTEANELYPHCAEEYYQRISMQRLAMARCRSLNALIDVSIELFSLPIRKAEYWSKMVFNVRNLAAAWYSSDINRFGPIFDDNSGVNPATPNTSNSYNVRNVNTDGSLNNNNAYNGNNGVRPSIVQ